MLAEAPARHTVHTNRAVALASQRLDQAALLVAAASLLLFGFGILTPWITGEIPG